jgi:hypothetical protein
MPKGPQGQKRPADTVQSAIMGARIATGEIEEAAPPKKAAAGRLGGKKGGKVRAEKLTAKQRSEAATVAAQARWRRKT